MEETVKCLKGLLGVTFIFDAAFFVCFALMAGWIYKINERMKCSIKEEKIYTIRCIGRKPTTQCSLEWFTVGKEYPVKDKIVLDDQAYSWNVFKYDKLLIEAGGYLFFKVEK